MENNTEIGQLFKEKLNSLEATPKEGGWNEIQTELDKNKKKRRILIPFWFNYKILFMAGLIISGLIYKNSTNKSLDFLDTRYKKNIKTLDSNSSQNSKINYPETHKVVTNKIVANSNEKLTNNKSLIILNAKKSTSKIIINKSNLMNPNLDNNLKKHSSLSKNYCNKKYLLKNRNEKNKQFFKNNSSKQKNFIASDSNKNLISNQKSNSENPKSSENKKIQLVATNKTEVNKLKKLDSIIKKKIKKQTEITLLKDSIKLTENKNSKFNIFAFASPTIPIFNSDKSLLDSRLDSNSKSIVIDLSYGAYLCFEGSERFSIRIGLAKSNLKYVTNDVSFNTSNYSEIKYEPGFSNAVIYSQLKNSLNSKIIQNISYIEFPIEAKYKILDKKISLNAIGGIQQIFLDKNEISFETPSGLNNKIGSNINLMKYSFGINLGLGLDYKITKKLKFNLEPMLKYNLKINQNSNYSNPFSIRVLTGFQYRIGE